MGNLTWSQEIPALRLWGEAQRLAEFWFEAPWTPDETLQQVFDAVKMRRKHEGGAFHVMTRHGMRFQWVSPGDRSSPRGNNFDPHPDKTLSVLALLGLRSDQRIVVDGKELTLSDVIVDSIANFQLNEEVAWSAIALACFLPPRTTWTNKFHEQFDFDTLATHLQKIDPAVAPCFGCHQAHALAVLLRVDEFSPILSKRARERALEYLAEAVQVMRHSQRPNGGWGADWFGDRPWAGLPRANPEISVTGHLLETLSLLPASVSFDLEMAERACTFLLAALKDQSDPLLWQNFTAYSHAANALRIWYPTWTDHAKSTF